MKEDRAENIRSTFTEMGGSSIRTTAVECMRRGVFGQEWLAEAGVTAAMDVVRRALKQADINGLPFAGMTRDIDIEGAHLWARRDLWTMEDYHLNIEQNVDKRDANHTRAVLLRQECLNRFGEAPAIPGLPEFPKVRAAA